MIVGFWNPDRYVTADIPRFWDDSVDAEVTASGYEGRPGLIGADDGAYVKKFVAVADDVRFAVGCRIKVDALPAAPTLVMAVLDDSLEVQVSVALNDNGTLSLYRGNLTTLLSTSSSTINVGVFNRLAIKGAISRTNGSAELQLNSTRTSTFVITAVSGVNTSPENSRNWSGVMFGLSTDITIAHMYAVDGSGAINGIIPDALVRVLAPSGVGTKNDWTPNSGTIEDCVDDAAPDDNTTRIEATFSGQDYSVATDDLSTTEIAGVLGAKVTQVAKASASILARLRALTYIGGTTYVTPDKVVDTSDWGVYEYYLGTNPANGLPWTVTNVNDAEWGGRSF